MKLKLLFFFNVTVLAVLSTILLVFGEIFILDNVLKYHTKYSSNNIINIDYKEIYYNKKKYNYNNFIVWIDNENFIYEKDSAIFLNKKNAETKMIFSSNKQIIRSSIIFLDNILYYKAFDGFKAYDTINESYMEISDELYFEVRDGKKYIVNSSKIGLLSLEIKNKETNKMTIINEDLLKTCQAFNTFMKYKKICRLDNYLIKDDCIYMSFYFQQVTGDSYGAVFKYDIIDNKIECYDCFTKENFYSIYYSFIVDSNDLWFIDYLNLTNI